MRRNLIVINTYFQLITAINLIETDLKDDINDVIITDRTVGMADKVDRLKEYDGINNVIFIESKRFSKNYKFLKSLICMIDRKKLLTKKLDAVYDNMFFFNFDFLTVTVFDELIENNPKLVLNIYDEGFITYLNERKLNKILVLVRKIFLKKDFEKYIKNLYLYHPELMCFECKYNLKRINNLNNLKIKKIINKVFSYEKFDIKQKYIFFEESFFCDNKGINDYDLIKKIAEEVGKENFVIKLHPRNSINRFEKDGINVLQATSIPWEVIQMNNNFANKTLMTISSGSVLASRLYFDENIETYLLFNCTEKMSDMVTNEYLLYLDKLKKALGMQDFHIPKSKNTFLCNFKRELNG